MLRARYVARAISDALIGRVSSCSTAAAIADVSSFHVGSTIVEPMVTKTTPRVDALVSDCMRDSTSPKRMTPIADSSTSTAPSKTMASPITPRSPLSLVAPFDVAGDDRRADERHEGQDDGRRQERPLPGVHRPDDQEADGADDHAVDADDPIGQRRPAQQAP